VKLTIGMPTYDDWSGVYFTVTSLRLYHDLEDTEILVVDNFGSKETEDWIRAWGQRKVRYEKYTEKVGTPPAKNAVFEFAKGEYVICVDCHVLLHPGALDFLWDGEDLIHGPMSYDGLDIFVTHMEPKWRGDMWGIWANHVRRDKLPVQPFEIPMMGMGLFGCRRDSWLGFHPEMRGFGGEEGYIHEKFRKAGRKVICLPWMIWNHRFGKSGGYPLDLGDRVRNYLIGFRELGLSWDPIREHFGERMVSKIASSLD